MKKIKKIMLAMLTLCLGFSLMISTTACNVTKNEEGAFKITTPEVNNLKVQLTSNDVVTGEYYNEKYLTATVSPATSYNQEVDWSIAWANENSAWAKGKTVTDYVEVEPESDGSLSAYVICKQAFGEQINVIVSSRLDSSKRATCVCDYEVRILGFSKLKIGESEMVDGKFYNTKAYKNYTNINTGTPLEYTPLYSAGTINNIKVSDVSVHLHFHNDFLNKFDYDSLNNPTPPSYCSFSVLDVNRTNSKIISCMATGNFGLNALSSMMKTMTMYGQSNTYYNVLNELGEGYEIGVVCVAVNGQIGFNYPIVLTSEVANLAVNSVSLNKEGITF